MSKTIVTAQEREELKQKLLRKRKRVRKVSKISFIVYAVSAVALCVIVALFKFVPIKYKLILAGVLGVFGIVWALAAIFPGIKLSLKKFQSFVCILMSILFITLSVLLPKYTSQLGKFFAAVPEEGELNINVYVLVDSDYQNAEDLAGKMVAIQSATDVEYQDYAIKVINKEIQGNDIKIATGEDIFDIVDKLRNKEVNAIMLNESYVDVITSVDGYENFLDETRKVYTCMQKVKLNTGTESIGAKEIATKPFIIAITAVDGWDYTSIAADKKVRSDVNMVVAVNPVTKQIAMVTIPRDSYIALGKGKLAGQKDKLTHASTQGIDCWVETLNRFLGIKINYFFRVNFSTMVDIVDAIDGIDVHNDEEFFTEYLATYNEETQKVEYEDYTFQVGDLHLDGRHALIYCRERKHVKGGDMGRNKHQAQIFKAIVNKATSPSIVMNAGDLLKACEGKFVTDLTIDEVYALVQMQLDDMSDWNMVSYSITGSTGLDICATAPNANGGKGLSVVYPAAAQVVEAQELIEQVMAGQVLAAKE